MEQLLVIIQRIYELLDILNNYTQGECKELLEGYPCFLFEVKELLRILDRIVGGGEGGRIGVGRLSGGVSHGI